MAENTIYDKKMPRTNRLKLLIFVIIVASLVGGFFIYQRFQNDHKDSIYSVKEKVSMPDFDFIVTKAEFNKIVPELNQEAIEKYGGIAEKEDCTLLSEEKTYALEQGEYVKSGPSEQDRCQNRNQVRDLINDYLTNNMRLVISYRIVTKDTVVAKNLQILVTLDNKRNVTESDLSFDVFQPDTKEAMLKPTQSAGPVYKLFGSTNYSSYDASPIKSNIEKDSEFNGNISTDIRNDETSVNIDVVYKKDSKTYTKTVKVFQENG